MSVRSNRFSRVAILGVIAVFSMAVGVRSANAVNLTIDSSLSKIDVTVSVGVFLDGAGGTNNPDTDLPYAPGDVGPGPDYPDDPNYYPVIFTPLGTSVPQGDPGSAAFVAPGGVVPGFSTGASAQLNGSVSVDPGGFQINGAAMGLNSSGLWQPSNPLDTNGAPVASDLGVTLDLSAVLAPGVYAVARLAGTMVEISTGAVAIDGFGNFIDPNGTLNVASSNVIGFVQLPPELGGATGLNTVITDESAAASIAGTYTTVGPLTTLNIPNLEATTYVSGGDDLPGLYLQLLTTSTIVATALVPEPSTLALAGFGLVGLAFTGYRRIRK